MIRMAPQRNLQMLRRDELLSPTVLDPGRLRRRRQLDGIHLGRVGPNTVAGPVGRHRIPESDSKGNVPAAAPADGRVQDRESN